MNPKCPVCESDSWKIGFSKCDRRRYKCKSCGKNFNERVGTPFHWLHKSEGEVITATVMYVKYLLSSYQVSEILGFFWNGNLSLSDQRLAPKIWHLPKENSEKLQDQILQGLARR